MTTTEINETGCNSQTRQCEKWSIERQVRIASGLLILLGIALAYSICLPFIWLSVLVALGMVLSGLTNSCALGNLIEQLPWNK